jgi:hypothetical protein
MNWAIDLPCQRVRRENQHEHHNRSLVSPRSDRASHWGLLGCYRRGSGGCGCPLLGAHCFRGRPWTLRNFPVVGFGSLSDDVSKLEAASTFETRPTV